MSGIYGTRKFSSRSKSQQSATRLEQTIAECVTYLKIYEANGNKPLADKTAAKLASIRIQLAELNGERWA